jgi:hypothetical protein
MRRYAAIAVMTIYGILSIGIHLHLHYCCGKLSDVSLFNKQGCNHEEHQESCCRKTDHCCSYADISLKIDESHSATYFKVVLPDFELFSSHEQETVFPCRSGFLTEMVPDQHAPPIGVPAYVMYRSLLFYA